jgi:hypothetical protein
MGLTKDDLVLYIKERMWVWVLKQCHLQNKQKSAFMYYSAYLPKDFAHGSDIKRQ